ncbi:MAG TPA: tetratricopeptide repeat protein [Tepidisphaeraceae bacterium]|nr:tetratricopeptide repeat protein [Tepidisphaeraceae bacterium]
MLRRLVGGLAVVALASSLLFARQGTVTTKDGHSYQGDITEKGEMVEIAKVAGAPGPIDINRANVKAIAYPDEIAKEVHAALARLDRNDVDTRMKLAQSAMDNHAYDAAREALDQALALQPANAQVKDMLAQLNALSPPATGPATRPATTRPTTSATGDATGAPEKFAVKREVTAAEVNRIRQIEWRKDDPTPVIVQIEPATRKKFLAEHPEITPAEFFRLSASEQAAEILSEGKPELRDGVHIRTEPPDILEFKKPLIENALLIGCAAASCHVGPKAGNFRLYAPASNDLATYTNFLMLQKYTMNVNKTQRFMVDRQFPDQSLLLQFMLPLDVAETPHPKVKGFKAMSKLKTDVKYEAVLGWIQNLNPVSPEYGIDLSKPPPAKAAPVKPRARP